MRRVSNFHSNKKLLIISDYFDSALFCGVSQYCDRHTNLYLYSTLSETLRRANLFVLAFGARSSEAREGIAHFFPNAPERSTSDDYTWRDSCHQSPQLRHTVRMYGTPRRNLPRVDQLTGHPETHRHHHPHIPPRHFPRTKKIRQHALAPTRERDAQLWARRR